MKFEPRTCPWCKLTFAPRTQSQQFCSIVCSSNGRKRGAAAQCDRGDWNITEGEILRRAAVLRKMRDDSMEGNRPRKIDVSKLDWR